MFIIYTEEIYNGVTFYYREDGSRVLQAIDVAKYIVEKIDRVENSGLIDIWKMQKLVYYCQAWSLVWEKRPLFSDRIEAWANGPVCPALHERLKDYYEVDVFTPIWEDADYIGEVSVDDWLIIETIIDDYGDKSNLWLRELTHLEAPWNRAREGVPLMEPCTNEITHEMMRAYYGSL